MIFNLIFDHIYVLNLKKSVDRKIHIQNEFKRVGIEKYEFFEATPFDSDEVKNLMLNNHLNSWNKLQLKQKVISLNQEQWNTRKQN